jgi:predicted transcriptional regulator of viral defense system
VHPQLEAIAAERLGVFTSREALQAGYDVDGIRAELRTRRWVRLRRGVYCAAGTVAAADARQRHLLESVAVLLRLGRGPVLSHASAARLHELVVPRSAGSDVQVTDVDQWRTGRGYRVARAALPDGDVVPWLTYGATSAARTLVDCARSWPQLDSVIAMDAALNTKRVTRPALAAAVLAGRHRTGASTAARAYGLCNGLAESALETKGRLALLAAGLPEPELQVDLYDGETFLGRVDGWYEEAAVALEFDGFVKYDDPYGGRTPTEVLWEEKRREDDIRAVDVRMVRIVNEDFGPRWQRVVGRLRALVSTPYVGPRRFRVVRRPEPGATAA